MKGRDIIYYIKENHLEDALVTVTAPMYYNSDHDCRTTDKISFWVGSKRIRIEREGKKPKYTTVPTIDFYVDPNLY